MKSKDEPHLECADTAENEIDAVLRIIQHAGHRIGNRLQNRDAERKIERNAPQRELQQKRESYGAPVDLMSPGRQQNTEPEQNTDA